MRLRGHAEVAEHVGARPFTDAGEQDAASSADPAHVVGEESLDELARAPVRHQHRRLVAVVAGDNGGRRKSDGDEEEAKAREELPPEERHCRLGIAHTVGLDLFSRCSPGPS